MKRGIAWIGRSSALLALVAGSYGPVGAAAAPGGQASSAQASLYDLNADVTTSDGRPLSLARLRGTPLLFTMFFTTCPGMCPMMTRQIQALEDRLNSTDRAKLRIVMVSFDPGDTVERLRIYAKLYQIDLSRWTVARADLRTIAALGRFAGIAFQRMPNGMYAHDALVDLIDPRGRIVASVPNTSLDDPRLPALVRGTIARSL